MVSLQVVAVKVTEGGCEVVCQIVEDAAVKIADRIAEERAAQKVIERKALIFRMKGHRKMLKNTMNTPMCVEME